MIVLPDLEGAAATSAEPERSAVHSWVDFESAHFIERWEGLCRGACRVKRAAEVTAVRRTSTAQLCVCFVRSLSKDDKRRSALRVFCSVRSLSTDDGAGRMTGSSSISSCGGPPPPTASSPRHREPPPSQMHLTASSKEF